MRRRTTARTIGLVLALLLVASGCGSKSAAVTSTIPAGSPGAFPVTVMGVEIPRAPERIVSASASHTELLFAIGAGDDVVATDLFSDYPPAAAATEKIDAFNLSVEAVAALDPDLVVLGFDPGDVTAGLTALGIGVLLFDAPGTLDDVWRQIADLGAATGRGAAAATLTDDMRASIERVAGSVPRDGAAPTYYHELDPTYFTITSTTFLGELYAILGLENIADAAADAGFGYPQLNAEFIIEADPDYVFLADTVCCGMTAEALAGRPGWDSLTAVAEGRVVELDDSVASRWGPRIVEFLEVVAAAVGEGGDG